MTNDPDTGAKGRSADPEPEMDGEREILEQLRRTVGQIRARQGSRLVRRPAPDNVKKLLSRQTTASRKEGESSASAHSFNAYIFERVYDFSVDEKKSLETLREQLDRCQAVLEHFRAGQVRRGLRGKMANCVGLLTHRVLNWFITPSIMFDESVQKALCEITNATERMQRQISIIAAELDALKTSKSFNGRIEAHKDTESLARAEESHDPL